MKTTTSFTYPAFALFVLACFALSPQAFAEPTLIPSSGPACPPLYVKVCCTTTGVTRIHVKSRLDSGGPTKGRLSDRLRGKLLRQDPPHAGPDNTYR